MITLILIGIVGLPLGSRLLVDGGISLGHELGASETTVGLTLLAVGSSIHRPSPSVACSANSASSPTSPWATSSRANIFNILGPAAWLPLAPRDHLEPGICRLQQLGHARRRRSCWCWRSS